MTEPHACACCDALRIIRERSLEIRSLTHEDARYPRDSVAGDEAVRLFELANDIVEACDSALLVPAGQR
jgi:hypothetical protein